MKSTSFFLTALFMIGATVLLAALGIHTSNFWYTVNGILLVLASYLYGKNHEMGIHTITFTDAAIYIMFSGTIVSLVAVSISLMMSVSLPVWVIIYVISWILANIVMFYQLFK